MEFAEAEAEAEFAKRTEGRWRGMYLAAVSTT